MSKPNKVNKTNYVQRGRLTPDEMARERIRQDEMSGHAKVEREHHREDSGASRRTGVQPSSKRARRMSVTTSP